MNTLIPDKFDDDRDQAVARRLARLRTMPVDTTRLERLLEGQIPPAPSQNRPKRLLWLRPMRAIVASIIVLAMIGGLIWSTASGPVMASAADMTQIYHEMISDSSDVIKVDSMQQASEVLSGKWPQSPGLPQSFSSHVMACCMLSIKNRKMACVLFRNDGYPVTLSVAKSSDLRSPQSPAVTRNGFTYHVESSGEMNMVSTQRDGRWICLIGKLPADRLIEIANELRFQ